MIRRLFSLAVVLCGGQALAAPPIELALPQGATISAERELPGTSLEFPLGPWRDGAITARHIEGYRTDTAWRLRANQTTSLQIMAPLREQLGVAGFGFLFECETEGCGGFDFRYAIDILPEPEMHVDLGDFRYLAARKGDMFVGLMVSRSSESGFVHLTTLQAQKVEPAELRNDLSSPTRATPVTPQTGTALPPLSGGDLAQQLESAGHIPLEDLMFESGQATLNGTDIASLKALATYLQANPQAQISLVGHTDSEGSLEGNIALSKRRAEAVRDKLVADYGAPSAQITAEGAGWLSPRASNLTPEGRDQNRRVEVVLTSTQSWR